MSDSSLYLQLVHVMKATYKKLTLSSTYMYYSYSPCMLGNTHMCTSVEEVGSHMFPRYHTEKAYTRLHLQETYRTYSIKFAILQNLSPQ